MLLKRSIFILFILCLLACPVMAGTYTVSPTGGNSDQDVINDALIKAEQAGGGTVYLNAGTYWLTDTVIIGSNTELTGDPNAILAVHSSSTQWFKGSIGIVSCDGVVKDVKIHGFQITGNCHNLDAALANTPGHDKDCQRCIILHGDSGNYAENIDIFDMKLYDSFSDGIYIYYAKNVWCYNNFISNCQHEGIFWSVVLNSVMLNNNVAGITSNCLRLNNCVNCKVKGGILFSYSGTHNNGAYKHGEYGIQIADAGSSHGYDARDKPTTTTNIEVTNVTFANLGLGAISPGYDHYTNVYIHDNKFIGQAELETMGIPVGDIGNNEISFYNVSATNQPTKEQSEQIFSSIFDFLKMKTYVQVGNNDTVMLPKGVNSTPSEATGLIEYYSIGNDVYTLISVPTTGLSLVQYTINGQTETHTRMIGANSGKAIEFSNTSIWEGNFTHTVDAVKIDGEVPPENISIKCLTPTKTITPTIKTKNVEGETISIQYGVFVIILLIYIIIKMIIFFIRNNLQ